MRGNGSEFTQLLGDIFMNQIVIDKEKLLKIISDWENVSRIRFRNADENAKRGISNSAMIYFNCSQELRRLIDS